MRYELLQVILLSLPFRLDSSAILPMLFMAAHLDPAKEATLAMISGNGSSAHATSMRGVHARIDRQLNGGFLLDSVSVQARWTLSRCLYSQTQNPRLPALSLLPSTQHRSEFGIPTRSRQPFWVLSTAIRHLFFILVVLAEHQSVVFGSIGQFKRSYFTTDIRTSVPSSSHSRKDAIVFLIGLTRGYS